MPVCVKAAPQVNKQLYVLLWLSVYMKYAILSPEAPSFGPLSESTCRRLGGPQRFAEGIGKGKKKER